MLAIGRLSGNKKIISPVYFFIFGMSFYFIIPIIIGEHYNLFSNVFFDNWLLTYNQVNFSDKILIITFCFLLFLCFCFGFSLFNRGGKIKLVAPISTSSLYVFPIFILSVFIWNMGKAYYFKGYSVDYNSEIMGKLATLQILLLTFIFLTGKKNVKNYIYYSFIGINSILLLSMGGRMYIILTVFSLLSFHYNNVSLQKKTIVYVIISLFVMVFVGLWRLDGVKFDLVSYIIFAEPVYTSFSLFSFVIHNGFDILNIPLNFFNSFLMSLPSFLIDKNEYLITVKQMGFNYDSPLGATSLYVSLIANFGYLGSLFMMFIFGSILSLSRNSNRVYVQCFYFISCGVIPFMFFRDAFGISIKVMFFNGLIVPMFVCILDGIVKKAINHRV